MSKKAADVQLRPVAQRKFEMIAVDSIDVVTSRGRGQEQFKENIRSIEQNGLYKPIVVNAIDYLKTQRYQLICGEGRWLAHKKLKWATIKAEIVDVSLSTAHIMSLGENMTRTPPNVMEFAHALQEMQAKGASLKSLEQITGRSAGYLAGFLTLVKNGEERLIQGVERGYFPLDFAMKVSVSPEGAIQHVLMDAFDKKMITAKHVDRVRSILMERTKPAKGEPAEGAYASRSSYTADNLRVEIAKLTKDRERYVNEVEIRETRVIRLIESLRKLNDDSVIAALLEKHQMTALPKLQGSYGN